MRRNDRLVVATLAALALYLAGCGGPRQLPRGQTYETLDGSGRIVVQTAEELDYIERGSAYQAMYLIQDDGRIRMTVEILGTAAVHYFEPLDEGLQYIEPNGDRGAIYFRPKPLAAARDAYYCAMVDSQVAALALAQHRQYAQSKLYAVDAQQARRLHRFTDDVTAELSGVAEEYFLVLATHPLCSKGILYHSEEPEPAQSYPSIDKAAEAFGELASKAHERRLELAVLLERATRARIETMLKSAKEYYGGGRDFVFQITFQSYDRSSGAVSGQMYYYDRDGAVLKVDGSLHGSTLHLRHTGAITQGRTPPEWLYTYTAIDDDKLQGKYSHRSLQRSGDVYIDLNEQRRTRLSRTLKSQRPQKELGRWQEVDLRPFDLRPMKEPLVLTDVSVRRSHYEHALIWFGDVKGEPGIGRDKKMHAPEYTWVSMNLRAGGVAVVRFSDHEAGQGFHQELTDAIARWREQYPDL